MNTIYTVNEDMEWEYNTPIFVSSTLEGAIDFLANFAIEKGIQFFCDHLSYMIYSVPVDQDINSSKRLFRCYSSMSWETRGKYGKYETLTKANVVNAIHTIMDHDDGDDGYMAYLPNLPDVLFYMDQHGLSVEDAIRWDRQAEEAWRIQRWGD